ncbi:hypothetical protein ACQY0O_006011 [Thecaphora frezii]
MSRRGEPAHSHRPSSAPPSPELGPSVPRRYLQPSPYKPVFPSPLSQKPLQASVSSGRTGASTARSARSASSVRTSSTAATSRFSITQAFSSLRQHEVRFFDQVISLLPPRASDFAQLKQAYNVVLSSEIASRAKTGRGVKRADLGAAGSDEPEWDTNLWSCLLSLVKVRGQDWKERWDSVRLALGLEPRSSGDDDDDEGATTQSQEEGDSSSTTGGQSTADESADAEPRWLHSPAAYTAARPIHHRTPHTPSEQRLAGQKRKATVPHSRHETVDKSADGWSDRIHPSQRPTVPAAAGAGASGSSSGAGSYPQRTESARSSALERIERRRLLQLGVDAYANADPLGSAQARLQRLRLEGGVEPEPRIESSSTSEPEAPQSAAQKRFQEVVRNSQAEREALRRARLAREEAEEEQQWANEARRADRIFAHHLLRTCLTWWLTLSRRQEERMRNAAEAHDRIVMARGWDRWKEVARREAGERTRAEKIDYVRCKLGAWRRWRRLLKQRQESRQEEKKEALRKAYYHVAKRMRTRIVSDCYRTWRDLYLERVADAIRRRHLQQGAFAIWQLRLARSALLRIQEYELAQRYRFRLLDASWHQWHRSTTLAIKQRTLTVEVDHHLLRDAFATWRKQTMLHELAEAFVRRRLQTAGFVGWIEARHAAIEQRRKEALADRWRSRKAKRSALQHWQRRLATLDELERRGDRLVQQLDRCRVRTALSVWLAEERGALLVRVRQTRVVEGHFARWKQTHRSLVASLEQRKSTVSARHDQNALASAWTQWRTRVSYVQTMQRVAQETDSARTLLRCLDAWRRRTSKQQLDEQRAAPLHGAFLQRCAMDVWTTRLRQSRLVVVLAERDRRLASTAMAAWLARLSQRRQDQARIAHLASIHNSRRQQAALQHWLHLTIERRNTELNATLSYRTKLQQEAFYHWIALCLKHDDMLNLVQSHLDLKRAAELQRHFYAWLARTRVERQRNAALSALLSVKRHKHLTTCFDSWRSRYIESCLSEVEYEVTVKHHEVTMLRLLRIWKERTTALPAIQMRNSHLKRLAWSQWQRALPNKVRERRATKLDEAKLLCQVLERWKAMWKERRRLRAAQRFGAVAVSRLKRRSGGSLQIAIPPADGVVKSARLWTTSAATTASVPTSPRSSTESERPGADEELHQPTTSRRPTPPARSDAAPPSHASAASSRIWTRLRRLSSPAPSSLQ